jgi:uncharacterized protein YbaA (DUF1428 family)
VIFSWIEYPDMTTRDTANEKMSADSETSRFSRHGTCGSVRGLW